MVLALFPIILTLKRLLIRHRHIRRRELLAVTLVAADPFDLHVVAQFAHFVGAGFANRMKRIVVDLAIFDDRNVLVQQARQRPQNAALRLPAQAEQNEIMAREHRVAQLRNHRVFVADDAGENRFTLADLVNEIVAHLVFNGDDAITRSAQLAEGAEAEEVFHCMILSLLAILILKRLVIQYQFFAWFAVTIFQVFSESLTYAKP